MKAMILEKLTHPDKEFAPEEANQALVELKQRKIRGAKVLRLA